MSAAPSIATNPLFDKAVINAFIDGVVKTLGTMANTTVITGKPYIEPNVQMKGDIAGLLGMTAHPLKGTLVLAFPTEAICLIYQNMLGEETKELTNEVADSVGELTNMIYGSAKTTLSQLGYKLDMAIPTVIKGNFTIQVKDKSPALVVPFELPNKSIFFVQITVST